MAVKKTKEEPLKPNEIYNPEEYCPVCGKHISERCEHIESFEKELQEEVNKQVEEKTEDPVMTAFDELENRPSDEQIEQWKKTFGNIYLTMLDTDVAVVYRKLKRGEYKALVAKGLQNIDLENEIFRVAVIWPKKMTVIDYDAGVVSTVATMILKVSGFISEQEAVMLTREL